MTVELPSNRIFSPPVADTSRKSRRDGEQSRRAKRLHQGDEDGHVSSQVRRFWRRQGWHSTLTRRILLVNVLVLFIPILGLLHLDQYRQSLVASELESLRLQGRAFSLSLGSTAVVVDENGEERLLPEMTRHLMRVLLADTGVRARVFAPAGELLADSFLLTGSGGLVQVIELPPPSNDSLFTELTTTYDRVVDWIPGMDDLPRYREAAIQLAEDYPEVGAALAGDSGGAVRADARGRLVLSVAVPVQRYRKVLGALMLSKGGDVVTKAVYARRLDILVVFAIALAATVLLSIYFASTLARPIRRLALAAVQVRYGKGRRFEIPDFTKREDEIGDLSGALREMTEALWSRLDAIEGFAADVAHEIKNPLTSLRSAVETVSRVEDPEQQRKLMSIILDDVQRLDRLISDISDASRLDAELSRAESETVDLRLLLETLVEVIGATVPETGPRIILALPELADQEAYMVPGIEGRLGQVFRNLINNAVTFSPPGGTIRVVAGRSPAGIEVRVEDNGPGLPEGKLEAVFERFYSERPSGEKFGTHSGLGLSISRQIVEAHGGTLHAENRIDPVSRKVKGARFVVRLPLPPREKS
jgi:two-component system sensor histidine kinase ChvG